MTVHQFSGVVGRRKMLTWLSFAAALPLVQACGGTSASPTTAPAPAANTPVPQATAASSAGAPTAVPKAAGNSTSANSVALTALYWSSSPADHQVFVDVFKLFGDKNPGITVTFDDTPSSGFVQKAITMIVGGTPPDTMELHPAWVLSFINAKQITDITDMSKGDISAYIPAQVDFWKEKGKVYGMPYYSGPSFIFYNKTLFAKYNAQTPEQHEAAGTWTWDTLQSLAKEITQGTGATKTFGWDAAQDASNLQFYTSVPVWDNKGEMTNQDETAWLIDQDPFVQVMQMHADMYLKEKSIPLPSDVQGTSWFFPTGRLGMAWAGRFRALELVNAPFEVGQVGTPKGKVGPINRDGPNASGLPVGTKNIPQAYKLARFIGSPEAAPVYLASGRGVPVETALLTSDTFKKSMKPYERIEVYQKSAATVRAWRVPGKGAEEGRAFSAEWQKVLTGQSDVPSAMKAAKATMDPLIQQS